MPAENVFAECLGLEFLALDVVARKSVFGVGDQDAAVRGAFHGTEDAGAGGGALEADVEIAFEGAAVFAVDFGGFGELVFAIRFLDAGEVLIKAEFFEGAAGDEKTGGVGGGPIG